MLQICNTGYYRLQLWITTQKEKTVFNHTKTNNFNANRICKYHITKLLIIYKIHEKDLAQLMNNLQAKQLHTKLVPIL